MTKSLYGNESYRQIGFAGRLMSARILDGTVDINNFPDGMYLLPLTREKEVKTFKVIKD